ncbi:hypothetical protein RF11_09997 [Thelohanellus kitauei]|uniref:MULE transposase domain-containing protein n=1 Tax=Thelohanellus kitauei TaxID=669202 RepID=A0A0C2JNN2_THEKT|nr:hypothetical protein RF11_09997 [Thelohanellus kitauei]
MIFDNHRIHVRLKADLFAEEVGEEMLEVNRTRFYCGDQKNHFLRFDKMAKLVPHGFKQCVIIMAYDPTVVCNIPCAWALLTGKDQQLYKYLLSELCILLDDRWMPRYCICDFEKGLLNAIRCKFPETIIHQQSMKARTNNCLERYNRITNEKFANPHPNIQQFIDVLKKEESYYASLCRNIRSGALERELVTCVEKRNISEELIAYLQEFNPE